MFLCSSLNTPDFECKISMFLFQDEYAEFRVLKGNTHVGSTVSTVVY